MKRRLAGNHADMDYFQQLLSLIEAWLSPTVAAVLSVLSILLVLVSGIGALLFARWLPEDYFLHPHPLSQLAQRRDARYFVLLALRQLVGLCLLIAGLAMLVLPGQGLLTLVAALCVAEYPGKRALVHRLVRRAMVRKGLNALRRRAGRPPLRFSSRSRPPSAPPQR